MNIVMIFSCFLSSHTVYFGGNFARLLEGLGRKPGLKGLRFALVLHCCRAHHLDLGSGREVTSLLSLLISVGQDFGQLAWVILFLSLTHS